MKEESSRFNSGARRAWTVAAVLAIAVFGVGAVVAVTGCGGDDNHDSGNVNSAIDSIQSQASSVQSQVSSVSTQVQSQAKSISTQVQSVQSQIQSQTQSNGGSSPGY
jgi:phage-related protein